jgi:hypothetical protein
MEILGESVGEGDVVEFLSFVGEEEGLAVAPKICPLRVGGGVGLKNMLSVLLGAFTTVATSVVPSL